MRWQFGYSTCATAYPTTQPLNGRGGDLLTFPIVGDSHPAFNSDGKDDDLLVGRVNPNVYTSSMPPLVAQETQLTYRSSQSGSFRRPTLAT